MPSASSRRRLREEDILLDLLRPLPDPCATANARKVETNIMLEKVKNMLALKRSEVNLAGFVEAEADDDCAWLPEFWPLK